MRILFDHQIFTQQQFGGISRYYCALANQLAGYPKTWTRIGAPLHFNKYLAEMNQDLVIGWHPPHAVGARKLTKAMSNLAFPMVAKMTRPDLIHETYYASNPTSHTAAHRVLTVFDMIHEKLPGDFSASDKTAQTKRRAVQRADRIICISESTRRDLLETIEVSADKVVVTYLSYDALQPLDQRADALVGPAPFILHVGARKGYKNFAGLVRGFAASSWLKDNFRIVCFGGRALSSAEQNLLAELGLASKHVAQLAGGDDKLAALYKAAAAFAYPSRYEGFGIPPLEAMSLDCPVVCSNSSSIPEVVGNAGEYFDPNDTESIKNALERVLQSTDRRNELIALGRARRALFTWERCAKETYDVYRTLTS